MKMKNILIAQSGGPSVAINATVSGIVERCITSDKIGHIYGALNGVKGVLNRCFVDLTDKLNSPEQMSLLYRTPAAALGSCRLRLNKDSEEQIKEIIDILREKEIGYFIIIGGNDSMDTVAQLSDYVATNHIPDIFIMGAPKTIDNDLTETDHCPGFGSAAKYIATTFAEIERDCAVYDIPAVTVVEVMGRNAGWLTASSALSREAGGSGPQLIYLCERAFAIESFLEDVQAQLKKKNAVLVAVSEGIKTADGIYLSEGNNGSDAFGHSALSGTGRCLESIVRDKIGCKARSIELNLMQRCASHLVSATDLYESRMVGMTATNRALSGVSGEMATICRVGNEPYKVKYSTADVKKIANKEKKVPENWINPNGNDIKKELINYLKPLIQGEVSPEFCEGVPKHLRLY